MQDDGFDRSARAVIGRFRRDAARWVVPEGFVDPADVGIKEVLAVFRRHRQLRAVAWFRFGEWGHGLRRMRGLAWFADQRMQGQYGLDLSPTVQIDGGFYLAHPSGCAINAVRIGSNVTVVGAVTIGVRGSGLGPTIADEVYVGAGARVIGTITVGRSARVGANAVVLADVPDGATVVGAPARPVGARDRPGRESARK